MAALNDITLIQKFVKGEDTLLANLNLRIEPGFNAVQLLGKKGGLIATLKLADKVRIALVRRESEYWEVLHQVLQNNSFVPKDQAEQQGFTQYEQHEIPAGYKMNYTEATLLWKAWWLHSRQKYNRNLQLDILIFQRNTWYPIKDIIYSQGTLFIKTWISEVVLRGSDRLIWLSQAQKHLAALEACQDGKLQQKSAGFPKPRSQGRAEDEHSLSPAISSVLKINQGCLYIQTVAGEIVVEGSDLKYWLNQPESQKGSQ